MQKVYLSRTNLQALLNKLGRNLRDGPNSSAYTLVKYDTTHPKYPCSDEIVVTALEDREYYTDRSAGAVFPDDDPAKAGSTVHAPGCTCGFCVLGSTRA